MATATGTWLKVKPDEGFKKLALVAVDANDGIKFVMPRDAADEYIVIVAQNTNASAAKNVVIKAPTNGGYAATDTDMTLSLAAGEIAVCRIESARFANKDGSIIVTGASADVKVQAIY